MPVWTTNELLFYGGIALMCASVLAAVISITIFRMSGKRIKTRLEAEYGKPKH